MNNKQIEEYDEAKEKEKKAYNALIGQLKLIELFDFLKNMKVFFKLLLYLLIM